MTIQTYQQRLATVEQNIKCKNPLVHNITNYVTVNDCANIELAIGGSPIMADDVNEVEEIVSYASALVINIGTLNTRSIDSMLLAGKRANELNIPIILDPVGGSFTRLRRETVERILKDIEISVIKGNFSEILGILDSNAKSKGVDAAIDHENNSLEHKIAIAKQVAGELGCITIVTGAIDIIASQDEVVTVHNGHEMMSKITGTGCMLAAVLGVCCGGNHHDLFAACLYATLAMGISGEQAQQKVAQNDLGTGCLRVGIVDSMYKMTAEIIFKGAKINER